MVAMDRRLRGPSCVRTLRLHAVRASPGIPYKIFKDLFPRQGPDPSPSVLYFGMGKFIQII